MAQPTSGGVGGFSPGNAPANAPRSKRQRGSAKSEWSLPQKLVGAAVAVFLVSTFVAYSQLPRPDPFAVVKPLSIDWWQYPIERNAFKRLPVITAGLNDIFVLPGTEKLWAVGERGTILHSEDGGRTWVKQDIGQPKPDNSGKSRNSPLSFMPGLVEEAYAEAAPSVQSRSPTEPGDLQAVGQQQSPGKDLNPPAPPTIRLRIEGPSTTTEPTAGAKTSVPPIQQTAAQQQQIALPTPTKKQRTSRQPQDSQQAASRAARTTQEQTAEQKKAPPPTPITSGGSSGSWATEDLNKVYFVSEKQGWAVGWNGTNLHTTDGGATWTRQPSGTDVRLLSLQVLPDGQRGWAVGDGGTILHTTDGGATWTPQASGTNAWLRSLQMLDDQRAWVAGEAGMILHTIDGGTTWTPQISGTKTILTSLQVLPDGQRAWAVGENGTILHTTDGGTTWTPQASGTNAWLRSLQVLPDGQRVWAVGDGGTILHTTDGGTTWTPQASGTNAWLRSLQVLPDGQRAWAVGIGGTILHTTNGGATWTRQPNGTDVRLLSLQVLPDGQRGWAVGEGGTILHTTDGGTTWTPQWPNVFMWGGGLSSLQVLPDGQRAWAVGSAGAILHTTDGGTTWTPQDSGTAAELSFLQVLPDGQRAWAVGFAILYTSDGGITWRRQASGTRVVLLAVQFLPDGMRGWAVGVNGTILRTTDGGTTWTAQTSGAPINLQAVQFLADGERGWAVGEGGTILHTTDGGSTWTQQTSGTKESLFSLHVLPDGQQAWAVGSNGTILHTTDGGATWTRQTSGTDAGLSSLQVLPDGQRAWAVGEYGTILHTTDGGQTWQSPLAYSVGFVPWYYLAGWLTPLLLLVAARRAGQAEQPTVREKSVADKLISDRPLERGDPDPLKFQRIATALSRFLRNDKTEPPLTIAITGAWGTGKSSLMNLCKADLEQYGFRPVWFNVWHHQKEEHLLASLLESVRTQAVPSWWRPEHVGFRWRLLSAHLKEHRPLVVLLLLLAGLCGGYFLVAPQQRWGALVEFAKNLSHLKLPDDFSQILSLLGFGGTLAPLLVLWKGLTAFGLNPAGLLASASKGVGLGDLSAQTGFRQKFAAEFCDVTQALHPRTMLILIDDLDRCRPEKVLEVLEAINFLVASGECFVVMGLDLDRVERCVGLGFRDVAEELIDDAPANQAQPATGDGGRKRRTEFARQYMEKLINIEVPVPKMNEQESIQLVAEPAGPPEEENRRWLRRFVPIFGFVSSLLPFALLFSVLAAGLWVGSRLFPDTAASTPPAPSSESSRPAVQTAQRSGGAQQQPRELQYEPPIDFSQREVVFTPGQYDHAPLWLPAPVAILLLVVGFVFFLRTPAVVVKDSPEFEKALRVWLPLITGKRQTPRAVKRFVNRVRYFAMLQRPAEVEPTRWDRLLDWVGIRPADERKQPSANDDAGIPESMLVALSAIHHMAPAWLEGGSSGMFGRLNLREAHPEIPLELRTAFSLIQPRIDAHSKEFGDWRNVGQYREMFLRLSAGIRTS